MSSDERPPRGRHRVPLVMALGLFVILRFGKEEGDRRGAEVPEE
jgi:hypothetical protein